MAITYITRKFSKNTITVETANLEELNDAYTFLVDRGYTDDFPGSPGWKAAKIYSDQLDAMLEARPEVEGYRAEKAAAKRAERLAGKDILGM